MSKKKKKNIEINFEIDFKLYNLNKADYKFCLEMLPEGITGTVICFQGVCQRPHSLIVELRYSGGIGNTYLQM